MKDVAGRIGVLEAKHKELHEKVEVLEAERAPDDIVNKYKKEKLKLKDEIERLMQSAICKDLL